MPIIVAEPFGSRGRKDAKRHREKQKEAIREKLPEIISEESIITQKKGKIIKIPIKGIEIPTFKPKKAGNGIPVGIGQGKGNPGDVIDHRPGSGSNPGEPGQEPGQDFIETEVEIEELIEMMLEDLGLPRLEEKEVKELIVELGFKIKGITTSGPMVLLDRRKTIQEGIRRFWNYLEFLKAETKQDSLTCFKALKQAEGIINDAIQLIKNKGINIVLETEEIEPFPILANDDLRFKDIKKDTENQSMAVVIAMMDVSGSMGKMKKYLSRSMLFWLFGFLRQIYDVVEIRFIIHHGIAKIVDEETFFHTVESGGTNCYTAYELAKGLIDTEYPTSKWNVYAWHFSDGEDFNTDRTIEELMKLLDTGINMFGYGQIQPEEEPNMLSGNDSTLWKKFKNYFHLKEETNNISTLEGENKLPFLGVIIESRTDILPALKAFLKKDRWSE